MRSILLLLRAIKPTPAVVAADILFVIFLVFGGSHLLKNAESNLTLEVGGTEVVKTEATPTERVVEFFGGFIKVSENK